MATPAQYNIHLQAGDDYQITIRLLEDGEPIDTQGYVFKAQIRDRFLPKGDLIAEFDVEPVAGGAVLKLTSEQTRDLPLTPKLVWDVQSTSPDVRTWLSGVVLINQEVTE